MKRQIQISASAHSKNIQVIEHTPIYDWAAYEQRLKKHKFTQIRKKFIESMAFLCMAVLTFSILFLGE